MLLANPSLDELYHKSCALAEDPQELRDSFQHPARLIKVQLSELQQQRDWVCVISLLRNH